jgi:hypothetical protein
VSNWKIDRWERPGHPDHIEIHDEHYERSAEIDDGDLLVEHEVESDSYGGGSRTVRCRIPAIEIVALLRLNGYGVDAPSQPSPGAPAGTKGMRRVAGNCTCGAPLMWNGEPVPGAVCSVSGEVPGDCLGAPAGNSATKEEHDA